MLAMLKTLKSSRQKDKHILRETIGMTAAAR